MSASPPDPNVPYIERPEQHQPEDGEIYCFIDSARPCTAECVAYLATRPEGADYEGQQWSKCAILMNLHRVGKHAVALAGQGERLLKHLRIKAADEKRDNQPPPPRGG